MDETAEKIMQAAMELVIEKGYSLTTTKEIAARAGVNECTLFRRFGDKKGIVLAAMDRRAWNPSLCASDFACQSGDMRQDLMSFMQIYLRKVTPQFVRLSIGLRVPELYPFTAEKIMQVPQVYKNVLLDYFSRAQAAGKLRAGLDAESLAMAIVSASFGFVFLKASFGDALSTLNDSEYICNTVDALLHGLEA